MAADRAVPGAAGDPALPGDVADRLDLRKEFTFCAEVTAVEYDETAGLWTLRTADGQTAHAKVRRHRRGLPVHREPARFPGSGAFAGVSLHTGDWPQEPVDFTGKRVAVIGTEAQASRPSPRSPRTPRT